MTNLVQTFESCFSDFNDFKWHFSTSVFLLILILQIQVKKYFMSLDKHMFLQSGILESLAEFSVTKMWEYILTDKVLQTLNWDISKFLSVLDHICV